jgi:hypothetical protein
VIGSDKHPPLTHLVLTQVLIHRFRQGSPEEFWSEFSTSSCKRLSYTAIVGRLQEQREAADLVLAEKAREEYGNRFNNVFSYRGRGSEMVVMSKTSDIAKHYRKTHGLPFFE